VEDAVTAADDAVVNAWRIHDALVAWTSNVDSKASFALAIESAVAAALVALCGHGARLSHLYGAWSTAFFSAGAVTLAAALVCVLYVVRPRLRSKEVDREWRNGLIYFGHLRHWSATELEAELRNGDMLPILSRQLVAMSGIAWAKHRMLQLSMTLAPVSVVLIGVAAAVNG
jgi:Family of unknown function (DUF5706)